MSTPNYRTWSTTWVWGVAALRFASICTLPLGNGEAYYFTWSRHLDWSYYDHPPLVAWMTWLTTRLGWTSWAVRLGPVLCAAIALLLVARLAERLGSARAGFFAVVLLSALPVFMVSGFVLNPEAPLAPLWVGFLLAVERLRAASNDGPSNDEPWRPLVAGLLLGLAFLAKYTAILLVPVALAYLALSPRSRRWLKRPSLYAGGLVALVVVLPVILWNQSRGWPSLQLHFVERNQVAAPVAGENAFNSLVESASANGEHLPGRILRAFVGLLLSYSPLLSPLPLRGRAGALRRAGEDDASLFLSVFGLGTLLPLFAALVSVKDSEQQWTMVAFFPAAIAFGQLADAQWERSKALRLWLVSGVSVSAVAIVLINLHMHTEAIVARIPAERYDPKVDIANELVGWDQLRPRIAAAAQSIPGPVVLASNHYSLCGRLWFEVHDSPPVYCVSERRTEFDFMDRRTPPREATVLSVTNAIHDVLPAELAARHCSLAETVVIERAGRPVARYDLRRCPPLAEAGSRVEARGGPP